MTEISYKSAGVDIATGNEIVKKIKDKVKTTFTPNILSNIGGFAALIDFKNIALDYQHPVLVQSIDGVGTKSIIARMMNKYDTLGIDLLSATSNDILVVGAKPLTLLDYIASDKLDPDITDELITGMVNACLKQNVALVGGETAEMPSIYLNQEHDVVGIVTGIVEKSKIITGENITPSDKILGIASSGLHTNGYSLARKLFFDVAGFSATTKPPELPKTIGEMLLEPHLNYTIPILNILQQNIPVNGMVHITGGGFIENIPRVLPENCSVEIYTNNWEQPPIFKLMQKLGNLSEREMFLTFNMGIGFILIVKDEHVSQIQDTIKAFPTFDLMEIGTVISGNKEVKII